MKFVLSVLLGLLVVSHAFAQQGSGVAVQLSPVQQQDVSIWLRGMGQVKPKQSVEIRPQVDGVLVKVLVREGQMVQVGEVLALLDDRVNKANLAQAKARQAVINAQLSSAKLDLTRFQNLGQSQAVSKQTLDQQQAVVAQLEAELLSAEAFVVAQEVQLSFTKITSPVKGQVGIRNTDEGNYVRAGDSQSLFSVVQLDPISVEIALPQSRLPQLQKLIQKVHQHQPVQVQAWLQDGGELLATGQLLVLDNRVSASSGTVKVKADFSNAKHLLWPQQTVVVALEQDVLPQALTVPVNALVQGPEGPYVWVSQEGKAVVQAVEVVHKEEQFAVVTGVSAGQQVVVDGQRRLKPGVMLSPLSVGKEPLDAN